MFQLSWGEVDSLRSQNVTLNSRSQFATLKQGQNIKEIFQAIKQLLEPPLPKEKKIIGFRAHE